MPKLIKNSRLRLNRGMLMHKGIWERHTMLKGDDAEAVQWYRWAAEQENSISQFNLGEMYYRGR